MHCLHDYVLHMHKHIRRLEWFSTHLVGNIKHTLAAFFYMQHKIQTLLQFCKFWSDRADNASEPHVQQMSENAASLTASFCCATFGHHPEPLQQQV